MATIVVLWVASIASLYAQLGNDKTFEGAYDKVEAFQEQPLMLKASIAAVAVFSLFAVLKVRDYVGLEIFL